MKVELMKIDKEEKEEVKQPKKQVVNQEENKIEKC
jgi:hypothetical protein